MTVHHAYRSPPHPWDHDAYWDPGHPFRFRSWLRTGTPWILIRFVPHGDDCEAHGGWHRWYNRDNVHSGCYHCRVVAEGRLWESNDEP